MKDIILTIIISTFISAVVLYGAIAFVVLDANVISWHYSCRIIYVILLLTSVYKILNKLTNGDKGTIQ